VLSLRAFGGSVSIPAATTRVTAIASIAWLAVRYRLDLFPGGTPHFAQFANVWLEGGSLPHEPFYPPGMILYYAAGLALFEATPGWAGWLLALSGVAEVLLAALLAARLFGERSGWLALVVLAIWPIGTSLAQSGEGESTPPLLFILLGLHVLLGARRSGHSNLWAWALAGLLLGLPGLIRSSLYLLAPFIGISEIAARRRTGRSAACLAVYFVAASAPYVAWAGRNLARTGHVILTSTQAQSPSVYAFTGIGEVSGVGGACFFDGDLNLMFALGSPFAVDDFRDREPLLRSRLVEIARFAPGAFLQGALGRTPAFVGLGGPTYAPGGENRPRYWPRQTALASMVVTLQKILAPWAIAALGLVGLLLRRERAPDVAPMLLVCAYVFIVHLPFHLEMRYVQILQTFYVIAFSALASLRPARA
jgi:hypothetical protein